MSPSGQSLECPQELAVDSGDSIRVYVRVRPPTEREQMTLAQPQLHIDRSTSSVLLRGEQPRTFTFDGVLGEDASQDEVFDLVGRGIGASCLSGYNGSVYVYGQTGTGKTFTMVGPVTSVQSMQFDERRGLICRILDFVFAEIHRRRATVEGTTYMCRCSFLEIYKETITDLLEPGSTNLQVREDMNRGIYVERLSEPTVWSLTEAFQVLWRGLQQRHIGATHINERSSRSHAVFTLSVEVSETRAGVTSTRVARLSLVDLAGSERQQGALDAVGATQPFQSLRVKEAGAINKSLSALTNVIMSLSRTATSRRRSSSGGSPDGKRPYVHYRDSKLTFLLRDSLGGNSKTVIVANASTSALCSAETLSTLKFAARAKHIRCAVVRNEEFSGTVESLMQEVKTLRQQLANLSSRNFAESHSQLSVMESATGDEDITGMEEDDSHILYSRERVRRLEVLLAAALERERLADHRRHQLHRLAEFLEDLDFRKGEYIRALHRDYSGLAVQLEAMAQDGSASGSPGGESAAEFHAKVQGFNRLLGNLIAGNFVSATPDGSALGESAGAPDGAPLATRTAGAESPTGPRGATGSPLARPGRRRGTSQSSLQRGAASALSSPQSPEASASRGRLSPRRGGASGTAGGLVDEAAFLRSENRRLQQQLECHPEIARLASENRTLRGRLTALNALGASPPLSDVVSCVAAGGRDVRSSDGQARLAPAMGRGGFGFIDGLESAVDTSGRAVEGVGQEEKMSPQLPCTASEICGPPVTADTMQRLAEVDEESTLRAWVHFQKMAKEVEELIRAKENLASIVFELRSGEGLAGDPLLSSLGPKGDALPSQAILRNSTVDPQVVEDLAQTTNDALALAQAIIENRGCVSPSVNVGDKEGDLSNSVEQGVDVGDMIIGSGGIQRQQRLSHSLPHLPHMTDKGPHAGGLLSRNNANRGLLPVSETRDQEAILETSSLAPHNRVKPAGLDQSQVATPAAAAAAAWSASAVSRGDSSPRTDPIEKVEVRQALQGVKHLHGTLDLVSNVFNDSYDQFQRLREEYESRLEECHFFELWCSRLDMHCHEVTERLHGNGAAVRAGIGSFSATAFSPASKNSQQRRCFSLSSLRDVNFWEQRFQELSQLTGGDGMARMPGSQGDPGSNEAAPGAAGPGGAGTPAISMLRRQGAATAGPLVLPERSLAPASTIQAVPQPPLARLQPAPVIGLDGQRGLPHSASLSALRVGERGPGLWNGGGGGAGIVHPPPHEGASVVRRVASAPLLPFFGDFWLGQPFFQGAADGAGEAVVAAPTLKTAAAAPTPSTTAPTPPSAAPTPTTTAPTPPTIAYPSPSHRLQVGVRAAPGEMAVPRQYVQQAYPEASPTVAPTAVSGRPMARQLSSNFSVPDLQVTKHEAGAQVASGVAALLLQTPPRPALSVLGFGSRGNLGPVPGRATLGHVATGAANGRGATAASGLIGASQAGGSSSASRISRNSADDPRSHITGVHISPDACDVHVWSPGESVVGRNAVGAGTGGPPGGSVGGGMDGDVLNPGSPRPPHTVPSIRLAAPRVAAAVNPAGAITPGQPSSAGAPSGSVSASANPRTPSHRTSAPAARLAVSSQRSSSRGGLSRSRVVAAGTTARGAVALSPPAVLQRHSGN